MVRLLSRLKVFKMTNKFTEKLNRLLNTEGEISISQIEALLWGGKIHQVFFMTTYGTLMLLGLEDDTPTKRKIATSLAQMSEYEMVSYLERFKNV